MQLRRSFFQLVLYLIVGALATLVEWAVFWLLNGRLCVHYAAATAAAFVVSTFANWAFGRLILFRKPARAGRNTATESVQTKATDSGTSNGTVQKSGQSTVAELAKIYAVSIIGLLMNLAIMFVAVEKIGVQEMPSKIIATGIVFVWNFLIRKLVIYRI